jgi:uncharacterized glyoxalase superfamily protein PhnB
MAVVPHSIDIVVADMARALAFYRLLGLAVPDGSDAADQAQIVTPGGASLGLFTEKLMRETNPAWVQPIGQRISFACRFDSAGEVDRVYAAVEAAGHSGMRAPWESFWGQRYAMLTDPDGNRVDLFAELGE